MMIIKHKERKSMYYEGIQSEEGKIVREEDALSYALERCLLGTKEDEVINLLNETLSLVPDNPLYDQYKSRSVANYSQALKSLIDAKNALERGKNDRF